MSDTQTHRYLVSTDSAADLMSEVSAAYYVHEEDFTVFKGDKGDIIASFANRHLVAIERAK